MSEEQGLGRGEPAGGGALPAARLPAPAAVLQGGMEPGLRPAWRRGSSLCCAAARPARPSSTRSRQVVRAMVAGGQQRGGGGGKPGCWRGKGEALGNQLKVAL